MPPAVRRPSYFSLAFSMHWGWNRMMRLLPRGLETPKELRRFLPALQQLADGAARWYNVAVLPALFHHS